MSIRPEDFLLTVVVPCYNEEAVTEATFDRICEGSEGMYSTENDFRKRWK
jgi:hypothetical protein